jgi:hypothetical protein
MLSNSYGNWRNIDLHDWVPREVIDKILAMPTPSIENGKDVSIYDLMLKLIRNFSVASAYTSY